MKKANKVGTVPVRGEDFIENGQIRTCKPPYIPLWIANPETGGIHCEGEDVSRSKFRKELEHLISGRENGSNTPDDIVAEFVIGCLSFFDAAVRVRERWYGRVREKKTANLRMDPCTLCGKLSEVWFHTQGLTCKECVDVCQGLAIPLRQQDEDLTDQVYRLFEVGFPRERLSDYIQKWLECASGETTG